MSLVIPTDDRPVLVALAGPNGAGKSTFHAAHLQKTGLPFINADVIAQRTAIGVYEAAALAAVMRQERVTRCESFLFETVFSDPVDDKLSFLIDASAQGYNVILLFVGLSSAEISIDRVGMRVLQGGHDVPPEKLLARYARSLENLRKAMLLLPLVLVYDNDDLRRPFRFCASVGKGAMLDWPAFVPGWLVPLLPEK